MSSSVSRAVACSRSRSRDYDFPAEVTLQILRFLPLKDLAAASRVCKTWRSLCKDPSLWKVVSFEGTKNVAKLPKNLWKRLDKLGTTCLDFHVHLAIEIAESAPEKVIHPARGPGQAIGDIIKRRKVVAIYFGVINELQLQAAVQNMPQLKILHVSHFQSVSPDRSAFPKFDISNFAGLKDLKELKITSEIHMIDMMHYDVFTADIDIKSTLLNLRKLVLVNCRNIREFQLMFLSYLPYLEHLELGNCADFTDFGFYVLQSLRGLQRLGLSQIHCRCKQGRPCQCLVPALEALQRITTLEIDSSVIPMNLNQALRKMVNLRYLEVWPFLDNICPRDVKGRPATDKAYADAFVGIFDGLSHLYKAHIGMYSSFLHGDDVRDNNMMDMDSDDELWNIHHLFNRGEKEEEYDAEPMNEGLSHGRGLARNEEDIGSRRKENEGEHSECVRNEEELDTKEDIQMSSKEIEENQATSLCEARGDAEHGSFKATTNLDSKMNQECPEPVHFEEVSTESDVYAENYDFYAESTCSHSFSALCFEYIARQKAERETLVKVFDMVKDELSRILPTTRIYLYEAKSKELEEENVQLMTICRKEEAFKTLDI